MDKDFKNKYLKYKLKYYQLKNLNAGALTETQEIQLRNLNVDNDVINDLKMIDYKPNEIDEMINKINIDKNIDTSLTRNKIDFVDRNDGTIIFTTYIKPLRESIKQFYNNYIVGGNYFFFITRIYLLGCGIHIGCLTINNIDIDSRIDENYICNKIYVNMIPKMTINEMIEYVFELGHDVERINKHKPVATFPSSPEISKFWINYEDYSLDNKNILNSELLNRGISIYNKIFYSREYLQRLCDIFGYTLQQGLEIVSTHKNKTNVEMYFIYCAFNNDYDIDDIIRLSNTGVIDISLYNRFMNE
jgi:hypothetical protein